jgi:RNA polymerase subunit RPABC4/transcription elongation factor Spt4
MMTRTKGLERAIDRAEQDGDYEKARDLSIQLLEVQEKNLCPVCHVNSLKAEGLNPISRRDNETEICESCGSREAFQDMGW